MPPKGNGNGVWKTVAIRGGMIVFGLIAASGWVYATTRASAQSVIDAKAAVVEAHERDKKVTDKRLDKTDEALDDIEERLDSIDVKQEKIFTILEERLPAKR